MKTIITILLSSFLLATSCSKEETPETQTDENGVYVSLPTIWKKSLHLNGVVSNGYVFDAIYYNNNIIIPTTNGGNNRRITMVNSATGDFLWHWDERLQPEIESYLFSFYHQYNNLLTWQTGGRSYCVNLDNGSTHWKFQRSVAYDVRLQPYQNDKYFTFIDVLNSQNNMEQIVHVGNLNNGNLTEFLRANLSLDYISPANSVGGIIYINEILNSDNLLVTYVEPLPNWYFNTFYGLYNKITNTWIWDRKLLATPQLSSGTYHPPIIKGNRIYQHISNSIVCHILENGEKIWQKDFNGDFMFSGFIIEDDKIIANCEDTYTYCLNPENGNQIWKVETAGTSGYMSYLNGIVYFVGGSTGKLHAIDVNTGKMVWSINANKLGEPESGHFKTNAVYVFPAENGQPAKVIALSHLNAYCFQAYK